MYKLDEDYRKESIYSCTHCNRPTGYTSKELVKEHVKECQFDERNKKCLMCKYLQITEEAPYPKNHKNYGDVDIEWAFGNYRQPYCTRYEKKLDKVDLLTKHEDCFEYSNEMYKVKYSDGYKEWLRLSTEVEEEMKDNGDS